MPKIGLPESHGGHVIHDICNKPMDTKDSFEDTAWMSGTNPNFNWLQTCSLWQFHQSNTTESLWNVSDYRQAICRQLTPPKTGPYTLNEERNRYLNGHKFGGHRKIEYLQLQGLERAHSVNSCSIHNERKMTWKRRTWIHLRFVAAVSFVKYLVV